MCGVMDLSNLDANERLALVALLKLFVSADGDVSEEEIAEIGKVVDAFGEEEYQRLVDEADRRFQSDAERRAFLGSITRQEAREVGRSYRFFIRRVCWRPASSTSAHKSSKFRTRPGHPGIRSFPRLRATATRY